MLGTRVLIDSLQIDAANQVLETGSNSPRIWTRWSKFNVGGIKIVLHKFVLSTSMTNRAKRGLSVMFGGEFKCENSRGEWNVVTFAAQLFPNRTRQ
jgi:hypothetical protein